MKTIPLLLQTGVLMALVACATPTGQTTAPASMQGASPLSALAYQTPAQFEAKINSLN